MKITLIGYGKMGKVIENIALSRGNEVLLRVDLSTTDSLDDITTDNTDVVIEFTQPTAAFNNISTVLKKGIPVVCGTTGWLDRKSEVEKLAVDNNTAFFYASNYSVGVNLFFHLNKVLAKLMNKFDGYDVDMEEIHHTEKLDAPSGTAITLAEGVIENLSRKNKWVNDTQPSSEDLNIKSLREPNVPGTHTVEYKNAIDTIEIKHTAHSREGFATGAVLAAEFLAGKKGVFGMNDLLEI